MSWGLWVHAGDVTKEGVPALFDEVTNVGKACTTMLKQYVNASLFKHTNG